MIISASLELISIISYFAYLNTPRTQSGWQIVCHIGWKIKVLKQHGNGYLFIVDILLHEECTFFWTKRTSFLCNKGSNRTISILVYFWKLVNWINTLFQTFLNIVKHNQNCSPLLLGYLGIDLTTFGGVIHELLIWWPKSNYIKLKNKKNSYFNLSMLYFILTCTYNCFSTIYRLHRD